MLIGITGTLGAGKGSVVDILVSEHGFKHYSVSDDFLRSEAIKRGREPDRNARRDIANEFREKGPMALMEAVVEAAGGLSSADTIVEPQHTEGEVRFIQEKGGYVIAVNADLDVRFARIKKRGSEKDNVTYEEFVAQQKLEMSSNDPNKNNIGNAMRAADFHIENNDTIEALRVQVAYVLEKMRAQDAL